jgi:hypothetical protein
VAEICSNLTPKSEFPGDDYQTFQDYYLAKYELNIKCTDQPLLDVDHTSARLNFLTPRYGLFLFSNYRLIKVLLWQVCKSQRSGLAREQ